MARVPIIVELKVQKGTSPTFAHQMAIGVSAGGFTVDPSYPPVPLSAPSHLQAEFDSSGHDVVVVRGVIEEDQIKELESHPEVVKVWKDPKIAPFDGYRPAPGGGAGPMAPCPVPPCDCTFGNPANGTMARVATYLGVDQIWAAGSRGDGITIGIVGGGICAIGRRSKAGEVPRIPNVIDGSLPDWGTTAAAWGNHGNMTSTDALGMAPNAHIYDIRISDTYAGSPDPTVSNALAGFQWAINRYAADGTPHILSNSWGIFQQSWDLGYATDPNHPFTRKVVEAIGKGILVLFAAGNCGATCPDGRCGADMGGGHDIWGANGHPLVMTVGAVNLSEQLIGYSSVGPAALDPNKPDFCSITHFAGYFPNIEPQEPSDSGTSAATPIAAGVVALLKQHMPSLTQDQAKKAIKGTAKDIGPAGFDQFTGAGIIRAKAAWDSLIVHTLKILNDPTLKVTDDLIAKAKSRLIDFRATPLSFAPSAATATFSDSRDGHHSWSLFGNSGSQPVQSIGAFATTHTSFFGNEGTPPNTVGTSRYDFSEGVEIFTASGTFTPNNGPAQKLAGNVIAMISGISLWSGKLKDQNTPAKAQYFITLTIRRQRLANSKFYLVTLPIKPAFSTGDVGSHKLRVYNDSQNTLLQEQDLVPPSDPQSNALGCLDIEGLVEQGDFIRVELISRFALTTDNSPETPMSGGSLVGMGFVDVVP